MTGGPQRLSGGRGGHADGRDRLDAQPRAHGRGLLENLVSIELKNLKDGRVWKRLSHLVLLSGPRHSNDVELGIHLEAQPPKHGQPISPKVSIVEHYASRSHLSNRVLEARYRPTIVEEPPVLFHQLLEQEGLPDARLPDYHKITFGTSQLRDLIVAPYQRNLRHRTSICWRPRQGPCLRWDAEQVSTPLGALVQKLDEVRFVVHLVQTDPELLSKVARQCRAALSGHPPSRRKYDDPTITACVQMTLDIPIKVALRVCPNSRNEEEALTVRKLPHSVHAGVATALDGPERRIVVLA